MAYHFYYVNKKGDSDGFHEVHTEECTYCPDVINRTYLGYYSSCEEAVNEARGHYVKVDGCFWCSRECHTR